MPELIGMADWAIIFVWVKNGVGQMVGKMERRQQAKPTLVQTRLLLLQWKNG